MTRRRNRSSSPTTRALARAAAAEVESQLATLPRAAIAGASWRDYGAIILCPIARGRRCRSSTGWRRSIWRSSPATRRRLGERIENAGAIFLGAYTPEAIGDYVGGSNHVLPTARSARFSSGSACSTS